jgi:hypothetical protein
MIIFVVVCVIYSIAETSKISISLYPQLSCLFQLEVIYGTPSRNNSSFVGGERKRYG